MVKICLNCGKEFDVRGEKRKITGKFCSQECCTKKQKRKERKPEMRRICLICGKRYLPHYQKRKKNDGKDYCSRTCYNVVINSDITQKCDYCGKEYTKKAFLFRKYSNIKHHYCSAECRNKANRRDRYNPERADHRNSQYKRISLKLRKEIKNCELCGNECNVEEKQAHHIIPPWLFDNAKEAHARENLLVLCKPCHKDKHKKMMSFLFSQFRKYCQENPEMRKEIIRNWNDGQ